MLSIYNPRQTVLISTRAGQEILGRNIVKDNLITVDWHMPVSFEPLLYAICIGKERFSLSQIDKSGVFVVNFMPFKYKDDVLYCGRHSGKVIDKFERTSLTKADAEAVDCCAVNEAVAWIECQVIDRKEYGDHVVFIGSILNVKENKNLKRLFHIKGDKFTTTK